MRVQNQVLRRLLTLGLYVGISAVIVACEIATDTTSTLPVVTTTPAPTAKNIKATLSGVPIAMRVPPGWYGRKMDNGIFVAEQRSSFHNTGKLTGMQVYVFVRAIDDFAEAITDSHPARRILRQIISQPALMGDSAVTDPQPFLWDGNDAAYYLVNDPHENVSLVMAVVIGNKSQLVAINISCPSERAASIRDNLPDLLADLWVNNMLMSVPDVDTLPDPLIFPSYAKATATP